MNSRLLFLLLSCIFCFWMIIDQQDIINRTITTTTTSHNSHSSSGCNGSSSSSTSQQEQQFKQQQQQQQVDFEEEELLLPLVNPRVCYENPYLPSLMETPDVITSRMNEWLTTIGSDQGKLIASRNIRYSFYDHTRFQYGFGYNNNNEKKNHYNNNDDDQKKNRIIASSSSSTSIATCKPDSLQCIGGKCYDDVSKITCGLQELSKLKQQQNGNNGNNQQKKKNSQDQEESPSSPICIVYSIGSNNQWEFEESILNETPCDVYTFDCTGSNNRFTKQPAHRRSHFYHICLGTKHEQGYSSRSSSTNDSTNSNNDDCTSVNVKCGETWTLFEIQRHLHHTRIDLLKMDIEGWEWPLLESWSTTTTTSSSSESSQSSSSESQPVHHHNTRIPNKQPSSSSSSNDDTDDTDTDTVLILPHQILVEIHYQTQFTALRVIEDQKPFKSVVNIIELNEHLMRIGYVIVQRDDNQSCPHCTELTLIRIHC